MKIYVCVKHVPDSAATIAIKAPAGIDENITFLLNPYDENALEAALRLKAEAGADEIVAVTLGKKEAANTLGSALAMGADRGIHILSPRDHDSLVTARALAAVIQEDGPADLILTGKMAIDSEGGQTMFRLGALLTWPVLSQVVTLDFADRQVTAECELETGGSRRALRVPLPCVIGTAKALNQPRYPTLPDIIKARKKPVTTVDLASLELETPTAGMELLELKPAVESRRGRILEGPAEAAVGELVRLLRDEAKVI